MARGLFTLSRVGLLLCLWLLDVAETMQRSAQLIGIDIKNNLFPRQEDVPSNVTFQVTSILDIPSEWNDKFSLVNQRLLVAGLRHNEWIMAIENIYRALKPGRWVQLCEHTGWLNPTPLMNVYTALFEVILRAKGIDSGLFPSRTADVWTRMVEDAGFEEIGVEYYEVPVGKWAGEDGGAMTENIVALLQGMKGVVVSNSGFGVIAGGEEGYERWMIDLVEEIDAGKTKPKAGYAVIIARKPAYK
ncbi:hypothetical protein D9756_002801 [Leucocoprinus leucothites]|uniref:S-adenosyl-L-methionine-dependent methyltransferase n=1 Tax=Leucocoprinus leucothites TaxID=201217 RepID=A0A8H5LLP7_9AGAR|nr:hypothetical protein D9756_002801 [Leucoagaricus leucothites]